MQNVDGFEGRFSLELQKRMDEVGVSIRDVALNTGATYEHIRRIVRGLVTPSKYLLKEICVFLQMDLSEAQELVAADQLTKKYGTMPERLAGKIEDLQPLEILWPYLTDEQKQTLTVQAKTLVERNRGAQ